MIDLLKVKGVNPIEKTEIHYLQFTRRATATTTHLAERMARGSSSYTKGEVAGVTLDLPNAMLDALLDGSAVRIDGLGTFKPRVSSQTDADPAKVTRASIKGVDIVFTPDAQLVSDLASRAEFRIVSKTTIEGEQDIPSNPPAVTESPTPSNPGASGDGTEFDG